MPVKCNHWRDAPMTGCAEIALSNWCHRHMIVTATRLLPVFWSCFTFDVRSITVTGKHANSDMQAKSFNEV